MTTFHAAVLPRVSGCGWLAARKGGERKSENARGRRKALLALLDRPRPPLAFFPLFFPLSFALSFFSPFLLTRPPQTLSFSLFFPSFLQLPTPSALPRNSKGGCGSCCGSGGSSGGSSGLFVARRSIAAPASSSSSSVSGPGADPSRRVVVTGMGVVSCLGNEVDEFYGNLLAVSVFIRVD